MTTTIDFGASERVFDVISPAYLALQKGSTAILARIQGGGQQTLRFSTPLDIDGLVYVSDDTGKAYSNKVRVTAQDASTRCVRVTAVARSQDLAANGGRTPIVLSPCGERATEHGDGGAFGASVGSDGPVAEVTRELCTTVRYADGRTHRMCQTLAAPLNLPQQSDPSADGAIETWTTDPSESLFKRIQNKIRM
jgi:hypothetical protein